MPLLLSVLQSLDITAQLVGCPTYDQEVNLALGTKFYPWARHFILISKYWLNPEKSWHGFKIVDWDVKHQLSLSTLFFLNLFFSTLKRNLLDV